MGIAWTDTPSGDGVRIIRLRPGQEVEVVLLDELVGVLLHWVPENGSLPCLESECPWCPSRRFTRWYGPAFAWGKYHNRLDPKTGKRSAIKGLVELMDENIAAIDGFRKINLRIVLSRGAQKKSPQIVRVADKQEFIGKLPELWDVRATLKRIWGIDERTGPTLMEGMV